MLIIFIFVLGYLAIAFENTIRINKAASALITGVLCWVLFIWGRTDIDLINGELIGKFGEIAGILFFLLGAMTIVELIDAHDGFEIISAQISNTKKRNFLWIIGFLSFFLSAILDNLTTTIVMISIIRKLLPRQGDRWIFAGIVVIAANAGGAWSPMGDVTTTMLWMGKQITAFQIISRLILPSLACMVVPLIFSTRMFAKGELVSPEAEANSYRTVSSESRFIFFLGLGSLLFVPFFKTLTHLPPVMGMLLGLGIMWLATEIIHRHKTESEKGPLSVVQALQKTDSPTILFFLGILLAITALEESGLLSNWADFLTRTVPSQSITLLIIGLISAVIDNVPLVAALQGMYPLSVYPTDHFFWEFLAYATGTGGSILIIGSAAGIAAMGLENITFFWYLKKITWLALLGYLAGAMVYVLLYSAHIFI